MDPDAVASISVAGLALFAVCVLTWLMSRSLERRRLERVLDSGDGVLRYTQYRPCRDDWDAGGVVFTLVRWVMLIGMLVLLIPLLHWLAVLILGPLFLCRKS
jgi:hypothetical protein